VPEELRSSATMRVASRSKTVSPGKQEATFQAEQLSSDVLAFCALLARILLRCLRERNERVMKECFLPSPTE